MHAIYNDQLLDEQELKFSYENRSFQYGDGIFETIIVKEGKTKLIDYHLDRLIEGLQILSISHDLTLDKVTNKIQLLLDFHHLQNARFKLQVWRKEGGLYTPTGNESDYLLTIANLSHQKSQPLNIDFSEKSYISQTPISKFKTCNSLSYIIAGIEKYNRRLDDLILLNNEGYIAECISSNIFWIKDGIYYTPSLDTGCVAGIMRRYILEACKKNNVFVEIGKYSKQDILNADSAFTSNVTGCFPITQIGQKQYSIDIPDFIA